MKSCNRLHVGIFVNDRNANILRFIRCLTFWGMRFSPVWRDELESLPASGIDVLLLPGGWYGIGRVPGQDQYVVSATAADKRQGAAVRRFVRNGGGLVGVCAGAFNVVWLGLIDADISRTSGAGIHSLEMVQASHPLLKGVARRAVGRKDRRWQAVPVMRISGPVFFPKDSQTLIASYDWEQRLGAVLAADADRGRAVAVSPHPERTEHDSGLCEVPLAPLMPVAVLLRNALLWAAHREVPAPK